MQTFKINCKPPGDFMVRKVINISEFYIYRCTVYIFQFPASKESSKTTTLSSRVTEDLAIEPKVAMISSY